MSTEMLGMLLYILFIILEIINYYINAHGMCLKLWYYFQKRCLQIPNVDDFKRSLCN